MVTRLYRLLLLLALCVGLWPVAGALAQEGSTSPHARVMRLEGALTQVMADFLERGLNQAANDGAPLVVLELNTPGGQISLMERMVTVIRNSPVPVIVYVSPNGAMAGSAGTLITLAGHVSAMAPETLIGAASPVDGDGADLDATLEAKTQEALTAQVRALTARRPSEATDLAVTMITEARAVTAREALDVGLIDMIATSIPDLLRQADGLTVIVRDQPRTLSTTGLVVDPLSMSLIEQVLALLVNPAVLSILFSVGLLLIYIEVQTPGGWVAGLAGFVALLLAVYGSGFLPVNWFGIIFLVLAFGLFVAEAYTPATFGALTLGGVVCFVVGALLLFNSPGSLPYYQVSVPLVIGIGVALGAASLTLVVVAMRTRWRPAIIGPNALIGQTGQMRTAESAQVGSELWSVAAVDGAPLNAGDPIEVIGVRGLRLLVRKAQK